LGLFLAIGILSLQACGSIIKGTRGIADLGWMNELARMMQVSLIGYAVSGAFLGLAYFNYYYALIAIVVGMQAVLKKELAALGATHSPPREIPITTIRSHPRPGSNAPDHGPVRSSPATSGASPKGLPTLKEGLALMIDWYRRL
jgi:hypothetical protein